VASLQGKRELDFSIQGTDENMAGAQAVGDEQQQAPIRAETGLLVVTLVLRHATHFTCLQVGNKNIKAAFFIPRCEGNPVALRRNLGCLVIISLECQPTHGVFFQVHEKKLRPSGAVGDEDQVFPVRGEVGACVEEEGGLCQFTSFFAMGCGQPQLGGLALCLGPSHPLSIFRKRNACCHGFFSHQGCGFAAGLFHDNVWVSAVIRGESDGLVIGRKGRQEVDVCLRKGLGIVSIPVSDIDVATLAGGFDEGDFFEEGPFFCCVVAVDGIGQLVAYFTNVVWAAFGGGFKLQASAAAAKQTQVCFELLLLVEVELDFNNAFCSDIQPGRGDNVVCRLIRWSQEAGPVEQAKEA